MHEGAGTDPTDDRFYLYRDLWTVAAIARASGFITEEYTYSVYGEPKLYQYTPGDRDGNVDLADLLAFQAAFTGAR